MASRVLLSQQPQKGRSSVAGDEDAACRRAMMAFFSCLDRSCGSKGCIDRAVAFSVWRVLTRDLDGKQVRSLERLLLSCSEPIDCEEWLSLMCKLSNIGGKRLFMSSVMRAWVLVEHGNLKVEMPKKDYRRSHSPASLEAKVEVPKRDHRRACSPASLEANVGLSSQCSSDAFLQAAPEQMCPGKPKKLEPLLSRGDRCLPKAQLAKSISCTILDRTPETTLSENGIQNCVASMSEDYLCARRQKTSKSVLQGDVTIDRQCTVQKVIGTVLEGHPSADENKIQTIGFAAIGNDITGLEQRRVPKNCVKGDTLFDNQALAIPVRRTFLEDISSSKAIASASEIANSVTSLGCGPFPRGGQKSFKSNISRELSEGEQSTSCATSEGSESISTNSLVSENAEPIHQSLSEGILGLGIQKHADLGSELQHTDSTSSLMEPFVDNNVTDRHSRELRATIEHKLEVGEASRAPILPLQETLATDEHRSAQERTPVDVIGPCDGKSIELANISQIEVGDQNGCHATCTDSSKSMIAENLHASMGEVNMPSTELISGSFGGPTTAKNEFPPNDSSIPFQNDLQPMKEDECNSNLLMPPEQRAVASLDDIPISTNEQVVTPHSPERKRKHKHGPQLEHCEAKSYAGHASKILSQSFHLARNGSQPSMMLTPVRHQPLPPLPKVPIVVPWAVRMAKSVAEWKGNHFNHFRIGNVIKVTKDFSVGDIGFNSGQRGRIVYIAHEVSMDILLHGCNDTTTVPKKDWTNLDLQVITHEVELIDISGNAAGKCLSCIVLKEHPEGFFDILCQDGREAHLVHKTFLRELSAAMYTDVGFSSTTTTPMSATRNPEAQLPASSLDCDQPVTMYRSRAGLELPPAGYQGSTALPTSPLLPVRMKDIAKRCEEPRREAAPPVGDACETGGQICPFMEIQDGGLRKIMSMVNFDVKDVVVDIGCGHGKILNMILQRFPCQGIGVEVNPSIARVAEYALQRYLGRASIIVDDIRHVDLRNVTATVSFMLSHSFEVQGMSLKEHLSKSLQPGSAVFNYTYPVPGWHGTLHNGVWKYIIGEHLSES